MSGRVLAVVAGLCGIAVLAIAALPGGRAWADPPGLVSYQGILLDADSSPREGSVDLELRLWSAGLNGTQLYRETHRGVVLVDGVFEVRLGAGQDPVPAPLSAQLFAGSGTRWLEVVVDPDGSREVLAPRQQILSVPYCLEAQRSQTLNGATLAQAAALPSPVSRYENRYADASSEIASAYCSTGTIAVGGGCECPAQIRVSAPNGESGWYCRCSSAPSRAWVMCLDAGARCGDRELDPPEQCDGPDSGACPTSACTFDCRCQCGNGIVDGPEICDHQAGCAAASGCNATCSGCLCGNGVIDPGEDCGEGTARCPASTPICRNCSCSAN